MGRTVAFFGMLLGERGVLTEASLFRARPNHVHTYFIRYPAAEYAISKPDWNLTQLSPPHVRVWPVSWPSSSVGINFKKIGRLKQKQEIRKNKSVA